MGGGLAKGLAGEITVQSIYRRFGSYPDALLFAGEYIAPGTASSKVLRISWTLG